jgi:hypothetical protein
MAEEAAMAELGAKAGFAKGPHPLKALRRARVAKGAMAEKAGMAERPPRT